MGNVPEALRCYDFRLQYICRSLVFEDRDKFKYLIQELKSTHALEDIELKKLTETRYNSLRRKRKNLVHKNMEARKEQLIGLFSSEVASDLLVFLAEEQERLQNEQCIHAFAMLAERERWRREAAESGRRQREDIFRRKQDNSFKQVMKVRQETVDLYLEDIILQSMNTLAEDEARQYIREMAKRVDLAAQEANDRCDLIEQEEMLTHLLHNFIVPEAHKEIVRSKLESRQRKYLEIARKIVNNELLTTDPLKILNASSEEAISVPSSGDNNKEELENERGVLRQDSNLKKTDCTEEGTSEMIAFSNERKERTSGSKMFPLITKPVKDLATGTIAFTNEIVSKAQEEALKRKTLFKEHKDLKIKVNDIIREIMREAAKLT